ncbi:PAS domain-containing sensor histidine kinase [Desulfolithobacter dissulfuricans]|uniref:histidine kinase n=1 Tax=Desulfolithobacter dissulfuricans TaxID=2795293 RepID=A0A915XK81_9BACT|nr:ATP-binding protein [Desulfolithobacter dissulfuricans]BCO08833.1 PAS domain-containing sensor histidine kinase [Desulfolithobacter dissulfuricans]
MLTPEQRQKKRRLVRYVIGCCVLLIPLLGYLQASILRGNLNLPVSSTVLVFALININALLLLLMLYLVLRNLVELIFERRHNILGSKLRTRLVVSFVSLSLIPTILLFVIALRFVSTSMDYWFNTNVEQSLQASLKLAQTIFRDTEKRAENMGSRIARLIDSGLISLENRELVEELFKRTLETAPPGAPDALTLIDANRRELLSVRGPRLLPVVLPEIPTEAMRRASEENRPEVITQDSSAGELVQAIVPLAVNQKEELATYLVTTLLIPAEQLAQMQAITSGINDYRQLVMLKAPIKLSLLIMLLIITLLILFGAIWFGFYIARTLTGPINKLAQATRRVAEGELDFTLEKESDDEMGLLVDSFNQMTSDLLASNRQLAQAHEALQQSNQVSEQRRRYLETILENVAAGVIAINENNQITTINRFAEDLLKINPKEFLHRDYHEVLARPHVMIVENFFRELLESGKHSVERHLRITVRRGETLSLLVNITRLMDENQRAIGYVIVFDNLTNLEKAQRLAAWQEVARRIAHEIKNPLTPIQLSAQRLRKRYLDRIEGDVEIFDQCTRTIVNQVDEIKRLVSEFSDFARMPRLKKEQGDLVAMARDVLVLYREAHKHIDFTLEEPGDIPPFHFDPVQMKRVLINLLDNAVTVLHEGGSIHLRFSLTDNGKKVCMEVADSGPGISEKVRLRLFEPYFSTRKSGTGLGLAIAHTIVSEHNGVIRVADNRPGGAVFIVELPLDS